MASGRLRIGFAMPGTYLLLAAQGSIAISGQAATLTYVSGSGQSITWTIPTQSADGTTLSDLAGFRIYYGTSPDNLNSTQDVANAAATSATVSGLTPGTWYFSVVAYDSDGFESVFSAQTSKVVT